MFVKNYDRRFKALMWSDSRLVNKQYYFCLCTKCVKEEYPKIRCPIHREFMKDTRRINIAAPVFACLEFEERTGGNPLNKFYEPTQEKVESLKAEKEYMFQQDFEEQKRIWNVDDNLQPLEK